MSKIFCNIKKNMLRSKNLYLTLKNVKFMHKITIRPQFSFAYILFCACCACAGRGQAGKLLDSRVRAVSTAALD